MRLAQQLYDEIVAHAREEAPNECCGMVATRDGEAVKVYRAVSRISRRSATQCAISSRQS
jgi:proteasome lid subunit RPN8/RPN11